MNRKWNYAKKTLFGMLILGLASPSFVGCKDYDDDIDDLQKQITENKEAIEANKKAIADIKSDVDAGAVLVDVQESSNGIVVKLSNGKSYTITNGKDGNDGNNGNDGADAPIPTFEVVDGKLVANYADGTSKVVWDKVLSVDDFTFSVVDGHLIVNGDDKGVVAGTDGLTPEIEFDGTKLVIKIGDRTIEKELKGEKGDDADLTPLKFQVNSVTGELEYTKDGSTWISTGTKVTGSSVDVSDLKFEIKDGVLYLNPNADYTQGAIGSIVPNEFKVGNDGYLYVNGKKTDALVPGVYMTKNTEEGTVTIRIPVFDAEKNAIKVDANGIVYEEVVIPLHINKIQVTSVTLVPMTENGDLKVYKLTGEDNSGAEVSVYATASQLRFRVNPEGAKLGTDFKMLEVMDQFKLSRSTGPKFSLLNAKQKEEDGLVYADFKFEGVDLTSDDAYTLAAGIENLYTNKVIYSDYVTFKPSGEAITPKFTQLVDEEEEDVAAGTTPEFELVREAGRNVNLAENIFVKVGTELRTIESYGFAAPTFEVKEVLASGEVSKNVFTVEGTTIKVSDVSFQAQGAEATFNVIAKVGDLIIGEQEIKVKMVEDIKVLNLIKNAVADNFNGSAREIALALEANAINQFNTYFNVDVTTASSVTVDFKITDKMGNDALSYFTTFTDLSETPKITAKAGTKDGVYNVVMTVTNTVTPTVKVMSETKFTITINAIKFMEAWKAAEYWQAGADAIVIKVDKTTGDFKSDLSKLFNIDGQLGVKVIYADKAGETKVKVEGDEAQLITPKNLAIGGTVSGKIVAQLVNTDDESLVVDEKVIDVTFENPIKSFTVTGENELTLLDATVSGADDGVKLGVDALLTLALKVDNRAGDIVNIITKDEKTGKNSIEPTGGMYGVSAIKYSLKSNTDDRFIITAAGELTWKNTSIALSQEVKATVVITIENNWKTITKEVTVTVKPN